TTRSAPPSAASWRWSTARAIVASRSSSTGGRCTTATRTGSRVMRASGARAHAARAGRLLDDDEDVAGADGVAGRDAHFLHRARLLGADVVLHLHRLEHEHRLTDLDRF